MGTHVRIEREENTTSLRMAVAWGGGENTPQLHKVRDLCCFSLPCPSQHVVSHFQIVSHGSKWLLELQPSHPYFRKEQEGKSKSNALSS